MTTQRPAPYLTVQSIADLLGVSKMTVYRLVNDGSLQAYRIGRSVRIRASDFASYMRASAISDWDDE